MSEPRYAILMGRDDLQGTPRIKAATNNAIAWLDEQAEGAGAPFAPEDFALVGRIDEAEAGILIGMLNYRWMFVKLLAIHPDHRRKGLGRGLMERAETLARTLDCIGMWLDTYTFQGPDYYPRLGFTECGRIRDFPPGHDRIYFEKRF